MTMARKKFQEYFPHIIKKFEKFSVAPKKISIKKMKTRWGSCSRSGNISLNSELVKFPKQCIEYVMVHECCHLLVFSHNEEFYALQDSQMPDWKIWKEKLNVCAVL